MTKTYNLTSTPLINTPGLVAWGVSGYHFKSDRKAIRRVFVDGYSLPEAAADALLSGKVPYSVNDENATVSFTVPA